MTATRDYVTIGVGRLPEKGRGPNTVKYLSIYLREIMSEETTALRVLDGLREWNVPSPSTLSFVLDIIGKLIGQPRPSGFGNDDYRFILQARVLARASDATLSAVTKLVDFLARGAPYGIDASVPEHWTIYFTLDLDVQWRALYARLLLDGIAATDSLDLSLAPPGGGVYDVGLYDVEIYG